MSTRFMFFPASEGVLQRTGQAIAQHGFDPAAFRVVLVQLGGSFAGGIDQWGERGLVEVSVTTPYQHTTFYRRTEAWLADFERDLASGGFDGPTEKPPRLHGARPVPLTRTLATDSLPALHLRSPLPAAGCIAD